MKRWLTLIICSTSLLAQAQSSNPFAESEAKRWAARQRHKDAAVRSEAASREKSAKLGALAPLTLRERLAQHQLPKPPERNAYTRVLEAGRALDDSRIVNNNEQWIDWAKGGDAFIESMNEAQRLYPQVLDPDSDFRLRFDEISRWAGGGIGGHNEPMAKNTRCPLMIAHMVAIEQTGGFVPDSFSVAAPAPPREAAPQVSASDMLAPPLGESTSIIKPEPIPERFEVTIRDGRASFGAGKLSTPVKTDLMGRQKITLPSSANTPVGRHFNLPTDKNSGFVTMPNGQTKRFRKSADITGGIKVVIEP